MNFSKLFLMMALGASLNNVVCSMKDDNNKKRKLDESANKVSKKKLTEEECTQLFTACGEMGNLEKVQKFIEEGVDLNIKDNFGKKSLYEVYRDGTRGIKDLFSGHPSSFKDAIQGSFGYFGYLLGKSKYGWTPLHFACMHSKKDIVALLLDGGADLNIQDNAGNTPLHFVCMHSKKDIFGLLLDNGANLNIQNNAGNTPLHMACLNQSKEIIITIIDTLTRLKHIARKAVKKEKNQIQILHRLCDIDPAFKKRVITYMMINKRRVGIFKVPKLVLINILLQSWDPKNLLIAMVNTKDNHEKTPFCYLNNDIYENNGNNEIKEILKPYLTLETIKHEEEESQQNFCTIF